MTFGERIYKLRTEKGMTQDELAVAAGYKSRSSIAKIESGERDPHQSMIASLAKALNTTPAYLMGWEEDNTPVEPKEEEETELSENEREMIDIFKGLTPTQQGKLIERARIMSEDNETETITKENAS